jgi:hypothetical protein
VFVGHIDQFNAQYQETSSNEDEVKKKANFQTMKKKSYRNELIVLPARLSSLRLGRCDTEMTSIE